MPDWKRLVRRRLAALKLEPEREAEIAEELAQHAEDRYRELVTGGATEAEARRRALEEIGERGALSRNLRPVERTNAPEPYVWDGGPLRDLAGGVRSLRRTPGLTLAVVAVLAIGIGANVAMFTVLDAVFLRPLRLREPERLVQIQDSRGPGGTIPISYPNFLDWRREARSFESMDVSAVFDETLKTAEGAERLRVAYVSPGFHGTYGVTPVLGRALTAEDDRPGAPPALVLSHAYWQSRFGGRADALGRRMTFGDQVWTVAGVMEPFRWQRTADVFVPVAFAMQKWGLALRENRSNTGVIARLRAGVSVEAARAEMKLISSQLEKEYPGANAGFTAVVTPLQEFIGGGVRRQVLLMSGAVAMLLLVACGNVAGLLLARAAVRRREMAIRIALGAARLRLVRQLLTESLLLAMAGAAVGLAVARAGITWLRGIVPVAENLGGIGVDGRAAAFAILAAGSTAVLFGLAPALQFTRPNTIDAIKAGGHSARGGALRWRTHKFLVTGQVALAVVLTVGVGLLLRSLLEALTTSPGFQTEHVVAATVVSGGSDAADIARSSWFVRDVTERLEARPGIAAAGAVDALPFGSPDSSAAFFRDDLPLPPPDRIPSALKANVTPGYFRVMGIPLLRGESFRPTAARMPSVKRDMPSMVAYLRSIKLEAVINETMARRYWPGEDPIGKTFRFGPPSLEGPQVKIIGLVSDSRQYGLDRAIEPQFYFSSDQFPLFDTRLVVRTAGDVPDLAAAIRKAVAECQPDAVVVSVDTMDRVVGRTLASRRLSVTVLTSFAGVALLLAALGLYATMSYLVAQRTQEIGVRMALGAARGDVHRMVVREGAVIAGAGVAVGLAAALAGSRVVAGMLYGVTATDAVTYVGSAVLLGLISLLATYLPARRASSVDPMVALRLE